MQWDLTPENYIGYGETNEARFDVAAVIRSVQEGRKRLGIMEQPTPVDRWRMFPLTDFVRAVERGKSGRRKELPDGELPLVSTSERENGISATVDAAAVSKIYRPPKITVSANGGSGCAFWHDYQFAANADVFVLTLKDEYNNAEFGQFLCAGINSESWRYNYYRKFNKAQLEKLEIKLPVDDDGQPDHSVIDRAVEDAG